MASLELSGDLTANERRDGPPRPGCKRDVVLREWTLAAGAPCSPTAVSLSSTSHRPAPSDLRRRLGAEAQDLRSTGGTTVMLRAPGLHGPEAVVWLHGMFAFACWDPKERRLLLARDPFGIKPLSLAQLSDQDASWSLGLRLRTSRPAGLGAAGCSSPRPAGYITAESPCFKDLNRSYDARTIIIWDL